MSTYEKQVVLNLRMTKCDFCSYEEETYFKTSMNPPTIKKCEFCGKDCCTAHRFSLRYDNSWHDIDIESVVCPDCFPRAKACYEEAKTRIDKSRYVNPNNPTEMLNTLYETHLLELCKQIFGINPKFLDI